MQKHVNLVDLAKSFPTNIYLQNLASIQKRTSPVKFAHLAEKSGKGSISNLSTKVSALLSASALALLSGFQSAPVLANLSALLLDLKSASVSGLESPTATNSNSGVHL